MKQGRSIAQLAHEIERQANTKRDFMVDTRAMKKQDSCIIDVLSFKSVYAYCQRAYSTRIRVIVPDSRLNDCHS